MGRGERKAFEKPKLSYGKGTRLRSQGRKLLELCLLRLAKVVHKLHVLGMSDDNERMLSIG